MMKTHRMSSLVLGLALFGWAAIANAQFDSAPRKSSTPWYEAPPPRIYTAINYSMAVPFASAGGMANTFSPLGFSIDVRYMFRPILSAGITFGWQTFDEESSDVVEFDNVSVQGKQLRYVNTMPMLAGVHAYLPNLRLVRPFAGFSLGTYFMKRRLDLGLYTLDDDTWHFGIAPEAGIAVRIRHLLPVVIVRYNHAFSSGGTGDLSFLTINIGLAWN